MATLTSSDPGFFQYFTSEELTTVTSTQIKSQLAGFNSGDESQSDLIVKLVNVIGESRVLAAVRSQLPVPSYTWTSATVVGK